MASSQEQSREKMWGVVPWVELPSGTWNAVLQASPSPKGDLKVEPFRGRMEAGDSDSVAAAVARVLADETAQLFKLAAAQLPSALQDTLHVRVRFEEGNEQALLALNGLYSANAAVLGRDATGQKGLAILYVPLNDLKVGAQPSTIRVTPLAIKIFEYAAKTSLASFPALLLKQVRDEATGLTTYESQLDGDAAAPFVGKQVYKVDEAQAEWRYTSQLVLQVQEAEKSKKETAAALQKKLREKKGPASARANAGPGFQKGPAAKGAARSKPNSKPTATSC